MEFFIGEKEIFSRILENLKLDWNENLGANFGLILMNGLETYTYNNSIFENGLKNIPQNQEEFDNFCLILEKEIIILSDLKFKKEVYVRALEKLNKIIEKSNNEKLELEDIGSELLANFNVVLIGMLFTGMMRFLTKLVISEEIWSIIGILATANPISFMLRQLFVKN